MHEITQAEFDDASRIFAQIHAAQERLQFAGTLQQKLEIRKEIDRLVRQRRIILGLE